MSSTAIHRRAAAALTPLLAALALTGCEDDRARADDAPAAASPSGEPMPQGDLPGWRQVFTDDFDRTELGEDWTAYHGQPGGDPYSHWEPDHVALVDGTLVLRGAERDGRWVTGGVSNWPVTQTYGRWEVRYRADASDEITYHFLLWPQAETWPPEIDFAEDTGGPRDKILAFLHYGAEDHTVERRLDGLDFTQWQTVGVQWSPGLIEYLVNGEVWATVASEGVPDEPMWLGLQSQAGGCERPGFAIACPQIGTPATANIEIDWVVVYTADATATGTR